MKTMTEQDLMKWVASNEIQTPVDSSNPLGLRVIPSYLLKDIFKGMMLVSDNMDVYRPHNWESCWETGAGFRCDNCNEHINEIGDDCGPCGSPIEGGTNGQT